MFRREVNYDMFNLHKWFTANKNKISLNEGKTDPT